MEMNPLLRLQLTSSAHGSDATERLAATLADLHSAIDDVDAAMARFDTIAARIAAQILHAAR